MMEKACRNKREFSRRCVIITILWSIFLTGLYPQEIKNKDHPNHYILLIDASGSVVRDRNRIKIQRYKKVLFEILTNRLYQTGFGKSVPPLDPKKDILTLLHFGIVPQGYTKPYERLKEFDLLKEYIRPRLIRQKDISQDELIKSLWPKAFNKLTLLLWSRNLALSSLLETNFNGDNNRTFLIMVHDGIMNDGVPEGEIRMARIWGKKENILEINRLNEFIENNYILSNGTGNPGKAWLEEFWKSSEPIFLEAYEVISTTQQKWESEMIGLNLFENVGFHWTKEVGKNPRGIVKVIFSETFLKQLENKDSKLSITFNHKTGKTIYQGGVQPIVEFIVTLYSKLPCQPMDCSIFLDLEVLHLDKLLGKQTMNMQYSKTLRMPKPSICTLVYFVKKVGILLILLFVVGITVYIFYFLIISTHIKIEFPGLTFIITIKRKWSIEGQIPNEPVNGISAFSFHLPSWLIQFLFYRKATIIINNEENKNLYWIWGGQKMDSIKFPIKARRVDVWWKKIPIEPTELTLKFTQGKHNSIIKLNFSEGIIGGDYE